MKHLSFRELEEGLSLLAEGLALDGAFDGCAILSRDIDWARSRCCVEQSSCWMKMRGIE